MFKEDYKECCRIADIKQADDVILFDIGINLMDLPISKFEVNLIKPIDNSVVLNRFKLENDKLVGELGKSLKEDKSLLITHAYQEFENIVLDNRYPNKRYTTLSAKSGKKKCKVGFPILIPKSVNTNNCKLNFEFTSEVIEGLEIVLMFSKNIAIRNKLDIQKTAQLEMRFSKGWEEFIEELQEINCLEQSNYELQVSNFIKEKRTSTGLSTYHDTLAPIRVEIQESEEKNTLIIEFEDEKKYCLVLKMNKALLNSDFAKIENGFEWFKIEGSMVTMLEQPVIKRKNVNFTFWHGGLLTGHSKFKFDGGNTVKIQTTKDLAELTHVVEQYNGIIKVLEHHAWDAVDFYDFNKISTWDTRLGSNRNYVEAFKKAIDNEKAKNDLAKFDKDIVELVLNNIVSKR